MMKIVLTEVSFLLEVQVAITKLNIVTRIFASNPSGFLVWVPRNYLRRGSLANAGLRSRSLSRESALPSESRWGRLCTHARTAARLSVRACQTPLLSYFRYTAEPLVISRHANYRRTWYSLCKSRRCICREHCNGAKAPRC